jgi:hypothetical protein
MLRTLTVLSASALMITGLAIAQAPAPATSPPALPRTPAPAGAKVYIVSPANSATVKSPFKVVFGLTGMGVAPAGVQFEGAGHHHLLIDTDLPANMGMPLPADAKHVHFGKGQTETTVELPPGKHTLQLVMGDHLHIPFNPPVVSEKITITVAP